MQGGNLDIISATEALSAWAVDDAVIVLFTGSAQNNIDAAGRDYMRKEWTVGVAAVDAVQPVSANNLFVYGHAFSGANLKRIAYPVGLALTQTMPKAIDEYCRAASPSTSTVLKRAGHILSCNIG
ncbi:unnamed protein product, partial [Mesorhabditis spiculigera]